MILKAEVELSMTLFHKQTMNRLELEQTVSQSWDEESEEYKSLCELAEKDGSVPFKRSENKNKFDEELLKVLSEEMKEKQKMLMETITNVFEECYKNGYKGYVTFAGYVVNPNDFCAVRVNKIEVKISKGAK